MSSSRRLPVVVDVPNPCEVDWEDMVGDERGRHCAQCGKTVRNLSVLDGDEIAEVLARGDCVSFLYRDDTSIVTAESAGMTGGVGARTAAVVLAATMALTLGCDVGRKGGAPVPLTRVAASSSSALSNAKANASAEPSVPTVTSAEPVPVAVPASASAAPDASCVPSSKSVKNGKQVGPKLPRRTGGAPVRPRADKDSAY